MFCRTSTLVAIVCLATTAQADERPKLILFENVRIFDGKSEALSASMNVLVRGNTIEKISKDPIPVDRNSPAKVIAGGGRTLMPGLIDAHWHTMLVRPTPAALLVDDVGYLNLMAGAEATDTLMRGFTTVRDGWAVVRTQARRRRGYRSRTTHLSIRSDHHGHWWPRRLPPSQ